MQDQVPILELRGVDKRFVGTYALKAMDLAFRAGEIHAIVGENGAGKSTLIRVLTGAHRRSAGSILWQGREVALDSPQEALALGINAVHQEVVLCPHLSVAANIFLGHEATLSGLLRHREMTRRAQGILDDLGFVIPAAARLGDLTIGHQQLVATARAAAWGVKFIIFDEPTAYLTRQDTDRLFALIRRLHAQGVTIVYISHRMEEIFQLAERVSVLRDGALVCTRVVAETDERQLIHDMVARSIAQVHHKESVTFGETLLRVDGLSGPGFHDVSLSVRRGEIVGLYGLIGAGRSEFVRCVFGRTRRSAGTVVLDGQALEGGGERAAIGRGIALVPESRRDQGLCLNMGVGFNLNLTVYDEIATAGIVDRGEERQRAARQMRDLGIVAASAGSAAATLSGGNQQKIVVGKWLNHGASLFIFDEPTVGVDVGTKVELYKVLAGLLARGAGVILISSYLPEVHDLADTLHVFRGGTIVATHAAGTAVPETILAEAIGV